MERQVIFKALVGSHNYQLNTWNSDKDYKVFVMPTFEDLYKGEFHSKAIISNSVDLDIHDIRKIPRLFYKSNINFLEVLFSLEVEVQPGFEKLYQILESLKEDIASMNLPYLYEACMGMSYQKVKRMDKYSESMEYSKQFGYNVKEATHAYRLLNFLNRYKEKRSFKSAIWYKTNEIDREMLMQFRRGDMRRGQAEWWIESEKKRAEELKNWYKNQKPRKYLNNYLESLIMKEIKKYLGVIDNEQ